MTSTFRLIPAMLLLAACMPVLPSDPMPDPERNACGAAALQGLVGQRASVLDTMRFSQPTRIIRPGEAVIYATTFVGPIRVIHPGQPVTEEYSAERTNFMLNAKGRITAVTCG